MLVRHDNVSCLMRVQEIPARSDIRVVGELSESLSFIQKAP